MKFTIEEHQKRMREILKPAQAGGKSTLIERLREAVRKPKLPKE